LLVVGYIDPPHRGGVPPDRDGISAVSLQGPFITTEELARMLRVDPSTVRRWRTARPIQGPPFIQLSERVIMYSTQDVQHWLEARRVTPEVA